MNDFLFLPYKYLFEDVCYAYFFSNIYFESLLVNISQTEFFTALLFLPLLLISTNLMAIHPGAQPKPGNDLDSFLFQSLSP